MFAQQVLYCIAFLVLTTAPKKDDRQRNDYKQFERDPFKEDFSPEGELVLNNDALEDFCVDVSVYSLLKFKENVRESCETEFIKTCVKKTEKVCMDVTEMKCEVKAFPVCNLLMITKPQTRVRIFPNNYQVLRCSETREEVRHTKMVEDCRNITRQNCITEWDRNRDGKLVWTGNQDCEPVTWRECNLVPRTQSFFVPRVDCKPGEVQPYTDFENQVTQKMVNKLVCSVQKSSNCSPVTRKACTHIQFEECEDLPRDNCRNQTFKEPFQERIHREKCLLPSSDLKPEVTALENDSSFPTGLAVINRVEEKKPRSGKKILLKPKDNDDELEAIINETYRDTAFEEEKLTTSKLVQSQPGSEARSEANDVRRQIDGKQKGVFEKVIQTSAMLSSGASSTDGMELKSSEEKYFERSEKSLVSVRKISLEFKDESGKDDTKTDDGNLENSLKEKKSNTSFTLRGFTIRKKNL